MAAKWRQKRIDKNKTGAARPRFSYENLAGAGGFEPPATGFGDQRSGQTELRSCDVRRSRRGAYLYGDGPFTRSAVCELFGAPGGSRTPDARLRTPPLYPLSYRGIMVEIEGLEPSASALRTPR
ncbi:uncharacterized protein METZ01_LOCUS445503, partial [marine metagenome]